MRVPIVAGLMAAAFAASAGDFGIDYPTAKKSLTEVVRPPFADEFCAEDVCSFASTQHDITVGLVLGKNKVVESFGLTFEQNNWAIAAAYGRSVQRQLLVPEHSIAALDDLARHAAAGSASDEDTPAVRCTGKQMSGQAMITCIRK